MGSLVKNLVFIWPLTLVALFFNGGVLREVYADYFDDPGNVLGKWRTDFNSQTEGSSSNPLNLGAGCYYPQSEFGTTIFIEVHPSKACPTSPTVYAGPYPASGGPFSQSSFWVVGANVELSYTNGSTGAPLGALQGPPNQSTRLNFSPNLMSFYMTPYYSNWLNPTPDYYKANLIVDNEGTSGAKFPGAIPFLSMGGHKNRGNAGTVGYMNAAGRPHKTVWRSTINQSSGVGSGVVKVHMIYAIAKWGGKNRLVFINLYHYNLETSTSTTPGLHRHWNWAAQQSYYYPGADIAYVDAEDIVGHCGSGVGTIPRMTTIGQKYAYSVDWENVFRCMSDKGLFDDVMPTSGIPILGVHWAVEIFGDASTWAIVEDPYML